MQSLSRLVLVHVALLEWARTDPAPATPDRTKTMNPSFQDLYFAAADPEELSQRTPGALKRLADAHRATPAQVALAWLLVQKPWIVPIPGTTKLHRLEENLESTFLRLSNSDLELIDHALSQLKIVGDRYPEASQKMIDR